ncbi:MAG: hypothetical protein E7294_14650 [Lachnospiraceae bacterium]|nr:hypothetical protein [Lachnospiraceae bacterium]
MYEYMSWNEKSTEEPNTIAGEDYFELLDLCFQYADSFSLSLAPWTCSVKKGLQTELLPFQEKKIETYKWFGYDFSKAPKEDRRKPEIFIYKAVPKAKQILEKYSSDIFLRTYADGTYKDSVQTLENLCFLKNGHIFLGTVSHEFYMMAEVENTEIEPYFMRNQKFYRVCQ